MSNMSPMTKIAAHFHPGFMELPAAAASLVDPEPERGVWGAIMGVAASVSVLLNYSQFPDKHHG